MSVLTDALNIYAFIYKAIYFIGICAFSGIEPVTLALEPCSTSWATCMTINAFFYIIKYIHSFGIKLNVLFLIVFSSSHIRAWARQLKACRSLLQSIDALLITNAFFVCHKERLCINHPWFIVRFETLIQNITDERRSKLQLVLKRGVRHWMETCCDCLGYYSLSCLFTQGYICSVLCIMMIKAQSHGFKTHMCVYLGRNDVYDILICLFRLFHWYYIISRIYFSYIWSPYLLTNGLT